MLRQEVEVVVALVIHRETELVVVGEEEDMMEGGLVVEVVVVEVQVEEEHCYWSLFSILR